MGFGDIAGGLATGGQYNLAKYALGAMGGGGSTSQMPLETPEQHDARVALMNFANTGRFGSFTAGQAMPLGYGDFSVTGPESQGLSSLQALLKNGIPDNYRLADESLRSFLASDPNDVSAQFNPFKAQTERQIAESDAALKRNAGFAGNLYSTSAIRGMGQIQAQGNETLTSRLADLTNAALNRRLQAIPMAAQLGGAEQGAALGLVDASQRYGDITRQLNTQAIQARDAELLRERSELTMPIQAAESVSGTPVQWGVPSVPNPSPYQGLLNMVGNIGGQYLGGAAFGAGFNGMRPQTSAVGPWSTGGD